MMKTVLIVEDDLTITRMLTMILRNKGYEVVTAVDDEAIRRAAEDRPDIILLDMMMPHMDGVEVGQRLRGEEKTRAIPIIAMSAGSDLSTRAQEIPADAIIAKPLDLTAVVACVERLAGSETVR